MRRTRKLAGLVIGCLILVTAATSAAFAKYTPKIGTRAEKDGSAYLTINGADVVRLETSNAGLTPAQRAQTAADRLTALLAKGLDPATIGAKQSGRNVRIMVGETLLMVATPAEAHAHVAATADLADSWARNIKKYLTMPPLSASPLSLTVPFGETRSIAVESFLPDKVEVAISDPRVASLDLQKKPGSIIVTGTSIGDATITLKCVDYTVPIVVQVRRYAATMLSGGRKAAVTGSNCPASLVLHSARVAAMQAVVLEPGARITTLSAPVSVKSLSSGQSTHVPIQVEVAGGSYIPIRFSVPVQVENRSLSRVPTTSIMYSNNPESVEKYQNLFTGCLRADSQATRLLYHHQNMMDRKVGFIIDVVNPSQSSASLHVIEGTSDPMLDTVIVGYAAGLEFMRNDLENIGRIYEIPPGMRQILVSQSLGHSYTASGIMELRQVSGDPLLLRVIAEPEDMRTADDSSELPIPAPGFDLHKTTMSDDVYPNPIQDVDITYTAGKAWVFFRLGKDGLKHATQNLQLYGNYGVTYDIKAKIENPSDSPITAEVAFEATAGPASGIFYVDGNLVKIRYLTPPSEVSIGRVTVPAGQNRVLSIKTIPLSGSAYPATLIIRPIGTVASAGG
jgi:hypothetical protein